MEAAKEVYKQNGFWGFLVVIIGGFFFRLILKGWIDVNTNFMALIDSKAVTFQIYQMEMQTRVFFLDDYENKGGW